ncbi:unnamed protein product [Prunus armeniaca]
MQSLGRLEAARLLLGRREEARRLLGGREAARWWLGGSEDARRLGGRLGGLFFSLPNPEDEVAKTKDNKSKLELIEKRNGLTASASFVLRV